MKLNSGVHKTFIRIATLLTFFLFCSLNSCSCSVAAVPPPSTSTVSVTPICNPLCTSQLNQPGIAFVGQVQSITQTSAFVGGGYQISRGLLYQVTLQLPGGSFPTNNDTLTLRLMLNNAQQPPQSGDYIQVTAYASSDPASTQSQVFTATGFTLATSQKFADQLIEYQGEALNQVTCAQDCAGQTLAFLLNGSSFSFTLGSQTNVQGFGTPPQIEGHQPVDVIVRFVQGGSYVVEQITNPSPTTTPTVTPNT